MISDNYVNVPLELNLLHMCQKVDDKYLKLPIPWHDAILQLVGDG